MPPLLLCGKCLRSFSADAIILTLRHKESKASEIVENKISEEKPLKNRKKYGIIKHIPNNKVVIDYGFAIHN